ncbi:MAG: DNA ligase (NAD(+)) LigA [Deltaproteobacteria bacterium]|nr:MAG: DNA ligase (NAD(+)) LigA [Deltaproteobacteria bacterium]
MAMALHYVGGRLVLAGTRGSGTVGEDVTRNVLAIPGLPHRIDADRLEVRGEVYMPLSNFRKVQDEFANPRNLTAGTLKQKEGDRERLKLLAFAAWELVDEDFETDAERFARLDALGIPTVETRIVPRQGLEAAISEWSERRDELDMEIDGIVVRANRIAEHLRLGNTEHHPRWAVAFKFQGESGQTHVEDVLWSVSRNGTITPVALVSPITLSGATISRASLANLSRFEELGLRRGSLVEVTRRGGVIPYVERVLDEGDGPRFEPPDHCPSCGGPVERRRIREAEFLVCANPESCTVARMRDLEHFARVLDMKGFGPKTLERMMDAGLISTPEDFFRLRRADLAALERLGEKSAENLLSEVERNREIPLAKFLEALGLPHVGPKYARILAERFGTLEALRKARPEDLLAIEGISEIIANAVVEGLAERSERIDGLLRHVRVLPHRERKRSSDGPLAGKSFVFTGTLSRMTREEAQAAVRELGGETPSGVSRKLSYLVVGAEHRPSSKLRKAQALVEQGAPLQIVDEDTFYRLLDEARRAGS